MQLILLVIILVTQSFTVRGEDLDPSTFKQTVLLDERVWLVDFYSKLCSVCAAFAPTWSKIESKVLRTNIVFLSILVDDYVLLDEEPWCDDRKGMHRLC